MCLDSIIRERKFNYLDSVWTDPEFAEIYIKQFSNRTEQFEEDDTWDTTYFSSCDSLNIMVAKDLIRLGRIYDNRHPIAWIQPKLSEKVLVWFPLVSPSLCQRQDRCRGETMTMYKNINGRLDFNSVKHNPHYVWPLMILYQMRFFSWFW